MQMALNLDFLNSMLAVQIIETPLRKFDQMKKTPKLNSSYFRNEEVNNLKYHGGEAIFFAVIKLTSHSIWIAVPCNTLRVTRFVINFKSFARSKEQYPFQTNCDVESFTVIIGRVEQELVKLFSWPRLNSIVMISRYAFVPEFYEGRKEQRALGHRFREADSSHDQRPRVKPSQVGSWSAPGREVTKPTSFLFFGLHFPFSSVTLHVSRRDYYGLRNVIVLSIILCFLRTHLTSLHLRSSAAGNAQHDINKRPDAGCKSRTAVNCAATFYPVSPDLI